MLVDYISPEKLPHLVCWLDWIFYAYKKSLFVIIGLFVAHYFFTIHISMFYRVAFSGLSVSVFAGICLWVCFIYFKHGFGLG